MGKKVSMADRRREERRKEEEALAEFRRQEGFLPYYSSTFFDRIKDADTTWRKVVIFAIFALELLLASAGKIFLAYAITACAIGLGYRIWHKVEDRMKRFGYRMEDNALVGDVWGKQVVIPYSDIKSALMTTPIKMTIRDMLVPFSQGYISFPYEMGNAKQQKHIRDCYNALREKVQCEMPGMEQKNSTLFDRMYTYNKTFRKCCIGLMIMEFVVFGLNLLEYEDSAMLLMHTVSMLIQCATLSRMARSIRLGMRNAKELQHKLAGYQRITYKIKYHKIWHFVVTAVVMIGLNALIVWYCQRVYL